LDCVDVEVPMSNGKSNRKLVISNAKAQELVALTVAFVKCNPRLFSPYLMPSINQLQLTKMITVLAGFAHTMYDMEFKRKDNPHRGSVNNVRTRVQKYICSESSDFVRVMPDDSHSKNKPAVPAWKSVNDLTDPELMQIEDNVVQPSLEHAERQVGGLGLSACRPLHHRDLPGFKWKSRQVPMNLRLERTMTTFADRVRQIRLNQMRQIRNKKRLLKQNKKQPLNQNNVTSYLVQRVPNDDQGHGIPYQRFRPEHMKIKKPRKSQPKRHAVIPTMKKHKKKIPRSRSEYTRERRQRGADHWKNLQDMAAPVANSIFQHPVLCRR